MSPSAGKILTYLNAGCPLIKDQKTFVDTYVLALKTDKDVPCKVCPIHEDCNCEVKNVN